MTLWPTRAPAVSGPRPQELLANRLSRSGVAFCWFPCNAGLGRQSLACAVDCGFPGAGAVNLNGTSAVARGFPGTEDTFASLERNSILRPVDF